jgi:hypothetical protein
MGLFGSGDSTKIKQINKDITDIVIKSAETYSSSNASNIDQLNTSDLIATDGAKISGINMSQIAKINLASLAEETRNIDFKIDLKKKINAVVADKSNGLPSIGGKSTNIEMQNIVENHIEQDFSVESIKNISADIKQNIDVNIIATGNKSAIDNITVSQAAKSIQKQVTKMTTGIVSAITGRTDIEAILTKTEANPIVDIVKAPFEAIGDVLSSPGGMMFMIIAFIAILVGGYFYINMKSSGGRRMNGGYDDLTDYDGDGVHGGLYSFGGKSPFIQ